MSAICLITPGTPSTNPRLVKEADALTEAGHQVTVVAARWGGWADAHDQALLATRRWSCIYVGGHPTAARLPFTVTRVRHRLACQAALLPGSPRLLARWAGSRVLPELARTAKRVPADLYIGHTLGALPAAVEAAQAHGAAAGFDAEDYLPDMEAPGVIPPGEKETTIRLEREYLARCDYITAASPGIGEAYTSMYGVPIAAVILNVFPLSHRPPHFRATATTGPLTLYWSSQTIGELRGLEEVVQAMGAVGKPDITLYLSGNWKPGYRDKLLQLATSCGVNIEQIMRLSPEMSSDNMVRRAAGYDVGLALEQPKSLNRDVCITNKVFTYILAGNALVATTTRGQRIVTDAIGDAAFCYDPGDVQTLAGHLALLHRERSVLDAARRGSWNCGAQRFNWDVEKRKLLAVVDRALGQSSISLGVPSSPQP